MAYITVVWFHPHQAELATDRLNSVHSEGHLLIGEGDRADTAALIDAGLALRSYRVGASPFFGEPVASRLTAGVRVTTSQDEIVPEQPWTVVYLTSLTGPLFSSWRLRLAERGFFVVEGMGDDLYTVRGPAGAEQLLLDLDFVIAARAYEASDTWYPVPDPSGRLAFSEPVLLCDLVLHRGATPQEVMGMVNSLGVPVVGEPGSRVRVVLARTSRQLARMAAHPDVALIQEHRGAIPANERMRRIVELPASPVGQVAIPGTLDGSGETVAVADTGVDSAHPALAGRVTAVDIGGRGGDTSDPTGHGTHVAATIAGEGANPGMAPAAELYVQSLTDSSGHLGGAADLRLLLRDAYKAGARIHNNSWTKEAGDGAYDSGARAIDEIVRQYGDLVVVVAAGNEGKQNGAGASPGCLANRTVAAPATAKNALAVGACCSDRTGVATTRPQTWRSWFPKFSADPIGSDALSGDTDRLDARSGRGPCRGVDRVKPDLVAPGTFVRSARACTAPAGYAWADDPSDPLQAYWGGTSMAAAVVSGAAALVRQYLGDQGHVPSAALVRAILLNGTHWLTGWDSLQDHADAPNYHQGFGRLNLSDSLPGSLGGASLAYVDGWAGSAGPQFVQSGQQVTASIEVGDGADLRICLVWDDPPGPAAQNCLQLHVENYDTDDSWEANPHAPGFHRVSGESDWSNTVQVVHLTSPEPGPYMCTITASNDVQDAPQGFALAITGNLLSALDVTGP